MQECFALCGARPKALPLETAAFEKAGETLRLCFPVTFFPARVTKLPDVPRAEPEAQRPTRIDSGGTPPRPVNYRLVFRAERSGATNAN